MDLNELRHWAVLGLETKQAELQRKIDGIFLELGSKPKVARKQKKHNISVEGRARIAAAQKKRWAAVKKSA